MGFNPIKLPSLLLLSSLGGSGYLMYFQTLRQ